MKRQALKYSRLTHYVSLALLVAGLSFGGWVTMGCSPQVTIPTGRLAAGQEGVVPGDDGGIVFDTTSTLETAAYELPSEVQYRGMTIPVDRWEAVTSAEGDRVNGNTAIIANDLTSATPRRTATFVGFWTVPGSIPETRQILFHIRLAMF